MTAQTDDNENTFASGCRIQSDMFASENACDEESSDVLHNYVDAILDRVKSEPVACADVACVATGNEKHNEMGPDELIGEMAETVNCRDQSTFERVGDVLQQARAAKSLTLEQVSRQTNIARRYLSALEGGQKIALSSTFIKGYIKTYAELLELDADFLVRAWGQVKEERIEPQLSTRTVDAPQREVSQHVATTAVSGRSNKAARARVEFSNGSSWSRGGLGSPVGFLKAATSAALPLFMLCVATFAYHAVDSDRQVDQSVPIAVLAPDASAPEKLGPLAHETIAEASSAIPPAAEPDAEAGTDYPVQDRQAEVDIASVALASNVASSVKTEFRPSGVITLGESRELDRPTVPSAEIEDSYEPIGPGAVEMIAQVQMQDRLVITLYEDSWVDVRDSSGQRLYRDLARAGRRIDVSGDLPFSLHVGNAPGLELELNGEPVEIRRYRSDNSARFTLASN